MTISTLLTNLKALLLTYNTLSKIRTFQRGVISASVVFPTLAIMPIRQQIGFDYSNGKYLNTYTIMVEVYDLKLGISQAKDNTVDLIQNIKTILQDNPTISDSVFDVNIESEGYGDTVQTVRGWLQRSYLIFSCSSKETAPTQTVSNTITNDVNPKDLQDYILSVFKANKATYYSTVNTIVDSPIAPIPVMPSILIGAGTKSRNQNYPNADIADIFFNISILTQLFSKEIALNHNLDIVEGVVDVLMANPQWGGRCDYSNILGISFESYTSPLECYATNIDLSCRIHEYQ